MFTTNQLVEIGNACSIKSFYKHPFVHLDFLMLPGFKATTNVYCLNRETSKTGVGNSFCLAGHIGNTIGLRGPVSVTWGL